MFKGKKSLFWKSLVFFEIFMYTIYNESRLIHRSTISIVQKQKNRFIFSGVIFYSTKGIKYNILLT